MVEATLYKVLNSKKVAHSFRQISSADMEYHMKLSQTMGNISREKQRICYDSSTFSTINLHLTVLKPMEQSRLLTKM